MKDRKLADLETRLTVVEAELRQLKEFLEQPKLPWWAAVAKSHENDPVFQEIADLGMRVRRGELEVSVRKIKPSKH